MEGLARRGFTGVLHTFSENDLRYYRQQLTRIVEVSHEAGLEVQLGAWAVAFVFGGEAESWFSAAHPETGQVFDDGRPVGAGCLNQPAVREYVRSWADAAVATGADRIFWDEPQWADPRRFGHDRRCWACRCQTCQRRFRERYGEPMPATLTPAVVEFRQATLVEFLHELVAHVHRSGGRSTVCVLPAGRDGRQLAHWEAVAAAAGLHTLATDPYWGLADAPASRYVGASARQLRTLADARGIGAQLWIQGFGLGPEDEADIRAAVAAARKAGVDDLWAWGFEACAHMPALGTRDPPRVWAIVADALTGR